MATDKEHEYWSDRVVNQNNDTHLSIIEALKPRIYPDGNQWCCIYGEMPLCVAGFGDTPHKAVVNFANNYYSQKLTP